MNSATTMLLALVPAGGHIITTTDCYRRTRQFIQTVLPKMGVTATVLDPSDMGALEKALEEHDNTSVYFSESPTNPYLRYSEQILHASAKDVSSCSLASLMITGFCQAQQHAVLHAPFPCALT